jgi:hypothetical protein
MQSRKPVESEDSKWMSLAAGLPGTKREMSAEIVKALKADGYLYLRCPTSVADHEAVAAEIGMILSRTDIKIDKQSELGQEQARVVKGRPGRYRADALGFHTDNVRVDVMSMYCVEQDATDGAILLLDTNDLTDYFSDEDLAVLSRIELWAPELEQVDRQESFSHVAPLLSRSEESFQIYYIPWLLRDSRDSRSGDMLKRFSDYVARKAETGLISLRIKERESVFVDNHRMLHGRKAIAENSKRHMVRFYIRAPADGG